ERCWPRHLPETLVCRTIYLQRVSRVVSGRKLILTTEKADDVVFAENGSRHVLREFVNSGRCMGETFGDPGLHWRPHFTSLSRGRFGYGARRNVSDEREKDSEEKGKACSKEKGEACAEESGRACEERKATPRGGGSRLYARPSRPAKMAGDR